MPSAALLAAAVALGRTYRSMGDAVIGCGAIDKAGWSRDIPWCTAQAYSLVVCLRGRGTYRDHRGRTHPIRAGTAFHRPTDRPHATAIDPRSGWVEAFILLDAGLAGQLVRHRVLAWDAPVFPAAADDAWVGELMAAQRELAMAPEAALGGCLSRLIGLVAGACAAPAQAPAGPHAAAVAAACAALAGDGDARLPRIAADAGISYERLRKIFRAATGRSPGAYRQQRRMDRAKGLLLAPGATVAGVAGQLGYADAAAFSHAFRRSAGLSPAAWRRRASLGGHRARPRRGSAATPLGSNRAGA